MHGGRSGSCHVITLTMPTRVGLTTDDPVMPASNRILWPLGGAVLTGASAWLTADALNEAVMYQVCKGIALQKADSNAEVCNALGRPLATGPWYNASLGLTHRGHIAHCQLTVIGQKSSSDIYMRVARKGGARSTLLYNLLGSAQWDVLLMEASIGRQAGLTQRVSLIEVPPLNPEREQTPHPHLR